MSDEYALEKSMRDVTNAPSSFEQKYNVRVSDSNGLNYQSNQINFSNLASLTTYDSLLSLNETVLEIPYTVHINSTADMAAVNTNSEAVGLKGFMNLISSFQVEMDNNNILNFSPQSQIPVNFKLLTSFSQDNVRTMGDVINFYPNDDAIRYNDILGEQCNYINDVNYTAAGKRVKNTNFDAAEATNTLFVNQTMVESRATSHYKGGTVRDIYFHYMAYIPLRCLSSFFMNAPLIRGAYFKMVFNVHTATSTITTVTNAISAVSASA